MTELVTANADYLNRRMQETPVPETADEWIQQIFEEGEIKFILIYGAGYLLTLATESEQLTEEQPSRQELKIFLNETDSIFERPSVDMGGEDETLQLGVAQRTAITKIRDFLLGEHAAGRRSFSIALTTDSNGSHNN